MKILLRSASIHAGRVRLALSRAIRSERPSDATPQSAASEAFSTSWRSPNAVRRRWSSPSSGRAASRPAPAGATTTGTRSSRAKKRTGYTRRRWSARGAREGREPERVAEQLLQEALRKRARVASRGATRFQVMKARLGDAPGARDLVADCQAFRDAVVVRLLGRGPELCHLAEPVGADDTALDR